MLNHVFISYRRENDAHVGRVRLLAGELRRCGLRVSFDEYFLDDNPGGPDEKWSRWCINQARDSACVLIVGSAGWYAAFADSKSAVSGEGCGAAAEANVIQEHLYQVKWQTARHRVVLLDQADAAGLPLEISGWRRFSPLLHQADLDDLVRWAARLIGAEPAGAVPVPGGGWPEKAPAMAWPMADHHGVREATALLLTRNAPWRFVPLRGTSETGKSHITRQLLANALGIPDLACGRFDFKGTTGIEGEVRALVQDLNVPPPAPNPRLNERLGQVLDALKVRARPALLIFDTYEAAGEAQDWVEKQLLTSLIRHTWLRVVIAGQRVPESAGAIWGAVARAPILLATPKPEDWLEFGKPHRPELTLDKVQLVHELSQGRASLLSQLLGPAN